jgi:cyclopropane-fatty-acyl-phospholipid synthase
MTDKAAAKRLAIFKRLLAHIHERLDLEFGFQVWDGSLVPAGYPSDGLLLAIADEGVVAAAIRRPNLHTLVNVMASGRLEIRNGTIFDIEGRRPKVRTKQLMRGEMFDRRLALETLARFLFVSRGGPWPLEGIKPDKPSSGDPQENKENIHFHYDLSNKFYSLFLDPEMGYTCGYYHDWNDDLATAQRNKFDYICRKLRLKPGERMLDIGCGWGGLICHAAQNYGVTAHGVTLAEEQAAWIRQKTARLGLTDRVTVELNDYTAVQGQFDKISQIEMFEHVGIANHPTFFRTVHRLLKTDGLYLHQATTRVGKDSFKKKRPELRVVTRYLWPGAEFDHIGMTTTNLERFGFEVHDVENWRLHQARSFKLWHDTLLKVREEAEREVGAVNVRMFLMWFAACSLVLERGEAFLFQTLASKRRRGASGLPPTRADLYRSQTPPSVEKRGVVNG